MFASRSTLVPLVLFILLSLLAAPAAHAVERFVSLTGNDAASGTQSSPFRTITKAASVALPGDVVSVRGGVYNEAVTIRSKGTASARITFRSYPGERAILDGTGLGASTIVVNLSATEHVDFTNFEVRNAPFIAVNVRNSRSTRVANNEIHHSWRNAIYYGADTMLGSVDALVENNVAYNNVLENQAHAMSGGWAGTIVVSKTNGGTIRGNRTYNNDGEGMIAILSDNITISGNEAYDNFSQGIYLDNARFTTVERNFIYCTGNPRYFRDGFPGQGIAIANEAYSYSNPSSDNRIVNNIVTGTRWGFYYGNFQNGGGLKNTTIANNTFYRTAQEILRITQDAHANSVVENNIFQQSGGLGPAYSGGGVTFRNNNWYGVNAGPAAGAGDVYGNPTLANPGGFSARDYKILPGSAALGGAVALPLVAVDYFGSPRATPIDIGAHQLGSASTPPPPPADTQAPSAPASLQVTGVTTSSVSLAWQASTDDTGVTGYRILRNGTVIATTSGTAWTVPSLASGTRFTFSVVALDAAGNVSASSNVVSATTLKPRRRAA
ncbi:MAG TPA: right-handed parallel beta-helix repeat-containing protein [Thermoanaerobaculia bacterium]|nr:right-handed parallel beta-helix repeat-containing protein [Thermoanaerobaculia bacterium]